MTDATKKGLTEIEQISGTLADSGLDSLITTIEQSMETKVPTSVKPILHTVFTAGAMRAFIELMILNREDFTKVKFERTANMN